MIFSEKEAEGYDQWYNSKLGKFVDEVETELAFSLFSPHPGEKVLDAGCGTGNFSLKLAQMGLEVVGVDISEPMLDKARKKVAKTDDNLQISFNKMDVLELQFPEESFSGVFSMATIEFIPDSKKENFIREMLRVVKPGGKVLIGTITSDSEWGKMYKKQAQEQDSVFSQAQFTTPEKLNQIEKDKLQASKECLFISPDIDEKNISRKREKKLAGQKRGGFFCSLWKKPEK
ncbi:MAG: class I SAM-dependent methyltransferase [Halanaerobiaceae bacterium]